MKRKLFLLLSCFIFFVFLGLTDNKNLAYAACPAKLELFQPNNGNKNITNGVDKSGTFPSDFKDVVNVSSPNNTKCFTANSANYLIIIYPQSVDPSQILAGETVADTPPNTYITTGAPTGPNTVSSSWDFTSGLVGRGQVITDGDWNVAVCYNSQNLNTNNTVFTGTPGLGGHWTYQLNYYASCFDPTQGYIGTIPIRVSSLNNSSPLPLINPTDQQFCTFQVNDPNGVRLTIKNLQPGTVYHAWWKGSSAIPPLFTFNATANKVDAKDPNDPAIIVSSDIGQPGKRTVCVDSVTSTNITTGRELGANCLQLNFATNLDPTTNRACTSANAGANPTPSALAHCDPACPAGTTCMNELNLANGVNFGAFSDLIQTYVDLPSACFPNTPTPVPCASNTNVCAPYACVNGICDTKTFMNGSPVPTASPLCPSGACQTAIGTIPTDPAGFISKLLSIILGISGGVATILIIFSGYGLMTSQGNPEKIQGAKEGLTAAISGLLFIIFAFIILQVITVDILKIPGFGK